MNRESPEGTADGDEQTVEGMMSHLEDAKQLQEAKSRGEDLATSSIQRAMSQRLDPAVLGSNHEQRLVELEENEVVTHRAGKAWKSAKVGVEIHGRLPIYYRIDGEITHTGYISKIAIDPEEGTKEAEEFVEHITDADTYADYNDRLDTTTYIVTDGKRLANPFPQSELQKLVSGENIDQGYSYQPAYVRQRDGDFPDFP